MAGTASSVYNKASPQSPVYQIMYDKSGKETQDIQPVVKVEWSVSRNEKSKVIQTLK